MAPRTNKRFVKSLLQLMNEGDWDGVGLCMKEAGKRYGGGGGGTSSTTPLKNDSTGRKTLGMVLMLRPPPEITMRFIDAYPLAVSEMDGEGCFPLHVACHVGSPPEIIKLLLFRYPEAIGIPDHRGMYPLHHAVEAACEGRMQQQLQYHHHQQQQQQQHVYEEEEQERAVSETVILVAESAPNVIDIPDDEDRSPLDIALMASTSESGGLFAFLQETFKGQKKDSKQVAVAAAAAGGQSGNQPNMHSSSFISYDNKEEEEEERIDGQKKQEQIPPRKDLSSAATTSTTTTAEGPMPTAKKQFLRRRSSADRATIVPLIEKNTPAENHPKKPTKTNVISKDTRRRSRRRMSAVA